MTFMYRDGWSFQVLSEDQQKLLVTKRAVGKEENLLSIIHRLQGNVREAKYFIQCGERGSVWIEISQVQIAALRAQGRGRSRFNRNRS